MRKSLNLMCGVRSPQLRAGFILVAALFLAGCDQQVYSNLGSRDANEMVALLYRNGINASREAGADNTYTISVDSGSFAKSVEILNRYGYPREQYKSIAEVFPATGLIVSPFEQHARLAYATSQELTKTINSIDGVVSARVHVVMPELDMRTGDQSKASASVMITHRPSIDTTALSSKVRLLVSNAIQGMNYKDVSIAFFPSDGTISGSLAADQSPDAMNSASGFDLMSLLHGSATTSLALWVVAGLVGGIALLIFLRRMQSRT